MGQAGIAITLFCCLFSYSANWLPKGDPCIAEETSLLFKAKLIILIFLFVTVELISPPLPHTALSSTVFLIAFCSLSIIKHHERIAQWTSSSLLHLHALSHASLHTPLCTSEYDCFWSLVASEIKHTAPSSSLLSPPTCLRIKYYSSEWLLKYCLEWIEELWYWTLSVVRPIYKQSVGHRLIT